ncbi:Acetyltransferase (GNAT) family protein [Rhizobiales bacterium GAS191]|jgi:GNAT superfamily N-acetyltransferase|nr:Acetyltransferase (GNAT) family protein [Rhizobiales bacterium GAS113]SED64522.1 Acetyltransferase (GNAT) family protein [Rhizobiales bacterium GAS191]SEE75457.1 Acetyltransferase (GNAT) family protein [Rhizobiales bacterium GAS188]
MRGNAKKNSLLHWRPARPDDLEAINSIGDRIHPDLVERPEIFEERFRLFPDGCMALSDGEGLAGYGLCHPWVLNSIPPLDTLLISLPSPPECIFVHDVGIVPRARGSNSAQAYIALAVDLARERGISALTLVSVYETQPLWERCGFHVAHERALGEKLKSYGATAKYMLRRLAR